MKNTPAPKIQIADPLVADKLVGLLDWVIETEFNDFEDNYEDDTVFSQLEQFILGEWITQYRSGLQPKVPLKVFALSNHPFAQAIFLRASWRVRE